MIVAAVIIILLIVVILFAFKSTKKEKEEKQRKEEKMKPFLDKYSKYRNKTQLKNAYTKLFEKRCEIDKRYVFGDAELALNKLNEMNEIDLEIKAICKVAKEKWDMDIDYDGDKKEYQRLKQFNRELAHSQFMKEHNLPIENKKEKSVVGQAVAGGIIAGPAGAVVGAINAADKNNKIRAEKASKQ